MCNNSNSQSSYSMKALSHREFINEYEVNSDAVFRLCLFKTGDREVALDITQDTFIKVWDYLQKGNNVSNLRGLIFTTARNLIKDYYKKHKSLNVGTYEDLETVALLASSDRDTLGDQTPYDSTQEIMSLINELSQQEQELIVMRLIDQLTIPEIAQRLQERENTVSVRMHRAVKKLREIVKKHYELHE